MCPLLCRALAPMQSRRRRVAHRPGCPSGSVKWPIAGPVGALSAPSAFAAQAFPFGQGGLDIGHAYVEDDLLLRLFGIVVSAGGPSIATRISFCSAFTVHPATAQPEISWYMTRAYAGARSEKDRAESLARDLLSRERARSGSIF